MENQLQDSALLHAIFDAAVDAIVVTDEQGTIQRANAAACAMFQRDSSELLGQSVNTLMPEAMARMHNGFLQHHQETGETRIIGIGREVEGKRKDGTVFPVHISVGRSEVKGQLLFVGILHDLTQRNATQKALARSQRLEAIGQMTGGIAHDFNNLLTVVIGNLELLEKRISDDQHLDLIADALDAAELGVDLTSRLMVFARKSDLKPQKVDLREICEDTLSILRRTLGPSFKITTSYQPDVDMVSVDPSQLQSALLNLALNARDAMEKGGELLISVSNVAIDDTYIAQETDIEAGDYVRLAVSDDGAGMSPEAQKRAFEPFFTTKSDKGGTGLGLAMVYGFVRQSGGHITLYSEVGLGSSFGLYFPALPADDLPLYPAEYDRNGMADIGAQGTTVLVVEDNPRVRRLSVERVADLGFEVKEAENADIAFEMIRNGPQPDLVFSDLVMHGSMNGYDLAERLAEDYPHIRVLLTSGYASDVLGGGLPNRAEHDILHKPYRQADLARRLHALLAEPEG